MDSLELQTRWEEIKTTAYEFCENGRSQVGPILSRVNIEVLGDNFLLLSVDSPFLKNYIETHYLTALKSALFRLYGDTFDVVIEEDTSARTQPLIYKEVFASPEVNAPSSVLAPEPTKTTSSVGPTSPSIELGAPSQADKPASLNPSAAYSFNNFVVGASNRFAYQMALLVAEQPDKSPFNPLFIYGKSGLGKTHLLLAIRNYIVENFPDKKVIYTDSSEFLSEITEAGAAYDKQKTSFSSLTKKYEDVDFLLIDDVQNFEGKSTSLDLLFQIFNKLHSNGKQLVLSADRNPKNIQIDERLLSRFNGGQTCNIQPPEVETKLGIIKNFLIELRDEETNSTLSQIDIPETYCHYIAESSGSNIRELKSAVTKIAYQIAYNPNCTLKDIQDLLTDHFSNGISKRLTVFDIQKEVESFFHVTHADLIGVKRQKELVYARHMAIYICKQMLDLPLSEIAKSFNRDHSTAIHAIDVIEDRYKHDRDCQEEVEVIEKMVRER